MSDINPGLALLLTQGFAAATYPSGAIPITGASGNVAAANAVATLAGVAGRTTYILGFGAFPGGATAAALVVGTITGVVTGTLSFIAGAPAGVGAAGLPVIMDFTPAIPASALNTAIVVTMPSLGTGNTNAAVFAWGFQL